MSWTERERAFYVGAPLALVPALGFLPAVIFLVIAPRVAHGRWVALVALPCLALAGSFGLWKLALGAVQRPFGKLNALSVVALLVLLVIAAYTGFFLSMAALNIG